MLQILHTIRLRVEQHSIQLDSILGILNSSGRVNASNEDVIQGPFDNLEDFLAFNKRLLTCKETKENLVSFCFVKSRVRFYVLLVCFQWNQLAISEIF